VEEETPNTALTPAVEFEIAEIKNELADIRQLLERKITKDDDR
jgi:hypothetical protein